MTDKGLDPASFLTGTAGGLALGYAAAWVFEGVLLLPVGALALALIVIAGFLEGGRE